MLQMFVDLVDLTRDVDSGIIKSDVITTESMPKELSEGEEEEEVQLDYSSMETRARNHLPPKLKWEDVSAHAKSYKELLNLCYTIDIEEPKSTA